MAASPFQWGHQIAWLISFLALPVLVGATVLLLVVLPALDTLSAGQVQTLARNLEPHPMLCLLLTSLDLQACHVMPPNTSIFGRSLCTTAGSLLLLRLGRWHSICVACCGSHPGSP